MRPGCSGHEAHTGTAKARFWQTPNAKLQTPKRETQEFIAAAEEMKIDGQRKYKRHEEGSVRESSLLTTYWSESTLSS